MGDRTQPWLQLGDSRELKASEQEQAECSEQEFFFSVKLFELWLPAIAEDVVIIWN